MTRTQYSIETEALAIIIPKVGLEYIIRDGLHVLVIMLQYHIVESLLFTYIDKNEKTKRLIEKERERESEREIERRTSIELVQ